MNESMLLVAIATNNMNQVRVDLKLAPSQTSFLKVFPRFST
jgi:hypothetical protein